MTIDAVLIAGPTASGKSAAALALAEALGGIVINADSMQVYREIRILSARPPDEDMARVPHLLYGHAGARERYSVGRYQTDAIAALAEARAQSRLPIFTGGTGLYFTALTEGLAAIPTVPGSVRKTARDKLDAMGVAGFARRAGAARSANRRTASPLRYPARLARLRSVRSNRPPAGELAASGGHARFGGIAVGQIRPRRAAAGIAPADRHAVSRMLAAGARAEAAALAGMDPVLPSAKILGLRELWAWEQGLMNEADAIALAVTATRQFAKRQMTWFRSRMSDWTWLDADVESNNIAQMRQFLS